MIFFNKKNTLKHTVVDNIFPHIYPAKQTVPDWYKDTKKVFSNNKEIKDLPISLNFKQCSPFGDSFLTGYMLPLSVDIAVKQSEAGPIISWKDAEYKHLEARDPEVNKEVPVPEGYSSVPLVWVTKQVFEIPKGYSALVTHPLNRYDLPFITLSGVVDGEFIMPWGNVPVFFSKTFEGIIKAGTPIAQIILFKREDWDNKEEPSLMPQAIKNSRQSGVTAYGWYKQKHWKKKKYD
jgi:hypothetical protein